MRREPPGRRSVVRASRPEGQRVTAVRHRLIAATMPQRVTVDGVIGGFLVAAFEAFENAAGTAPHRRRGGSGSPDVSQQ